MMPGPSLESYPVLCCPMMRPSHSLLPVTEVALNAQPPADVQKISSFLLSSFPETAHRLSVFSPFLPQL